MLCISVRQPWAWLIIHGGKDIENRDWFTKVRGRVFIHASKGMTLAEYEDTVDFTTLVRELMEKRGAPLPPFQIPSFTAIERGGIIGSVEIVDCVQRSESPWFMGKYGFVLRNPRAQPFCPYTGRLGFFDIPEAA